MKKPTSSTATPSESAWANDLTIVYFVGLAAGVKEGFIPSFGEKKITKGEWDYKAVRDGDVLTVTKEVNFWNRQSVAQSLASATDTLNKVRVQLESAEGQRDGAKKALDRSRENLKFVSDEKRATEEVLVESWELTLDEHTATYNRMKAKFDEAEKEVKRFQAVTFPDAEKFVIDLNNVKLA